MDVAGVVDNSNRSSFKTLPDVGGEEVGRVALQVGTADCLNIACFDDVDQEILVVIMRADLIHATVHV